MHWKDVVKISCEFTFLVHFTRTTIAAAKTLRWTTKLRPAIRPCFRRSFASPATVNESFLSGTGGEKYLDVFTDFSRIDQKWQEYTWKSFMSYGKWIPIQYINLGKVQKLRLLHSNKSNFLTSNCSFFQKSGGKRRSWCSECTASVAQV